MQLRKGFSHRAAQPRSLRGINMVAFSLLLLPAQAALGYTVLHSAPTPRATTPAMKLADDGILGVGVIGAGRIGLVHLEALSACESAKAVVRPTSADPTSPVRRPDSPP